MAEIVKGTVEPEPTPGSYRHFKGTVYEVAGIATHSETGERLVIYAADGKTWARPLSNFCEHVDCSNRGMIKTPPGGEAPYHGARFERL